MANEKNLIPINKRSKKVQREIQEKGRQANKLKWQQRKTLAEELLALLSEGETQKKMSLSLIDKALQGDTKAFEVVRDSIGEKPTDKVENSGTQTLDISIKVVE